MNATDTRFTLTAEEQAAAATDERDVRKSSLAITALMAAAIMTNEECVRRIPPTNDPEPNLEPRRRPSPLRRTPRASKSAIRSDRRRSIEKATRKAQRRGR